MMLLAIDPGATGGHTGIVLLSVPWDQPAQLVESWAIPGGVAPMLEWLTKDCISSMLNDVDVVVVEHFVSPKQGGINIEPAYVEGAIQGYLRSFWGDDQGVVLSPAAGKNTAVPDHAMMRLGFSKDDFAGDHHADRWEALRHALRYLKRADHRPTVRALFPND